MRHKNFVRRDRTTSAMQFTEPKIDLPGSNRSAGQTQSRWAGAVAIVDLPVTGGTATGQSLKLQLVSSQAESGGTNIFSGKVTGCIGISSNYIGCPAFRFGFDPFRSWLPWFFRRYPFASCTNRTGLESASSFVCLEAISHRRRTLSTAHCLESGT